MELLTILFMIDPDPSQGSRGLAVTLHSRCFHAKRRFGGSFMFSSPQALSIFFSKLGAQSPSFLSASASCEGKSQVKAFHRRTLARKNERYNLDLHSLPSAVTQHAAMPGLCFPIRRGSNFNTFTVLV